MLFIDPSQNDINLPHSNESRNEFDRKFLYAIIKYSEISYKVNCKTRKFNKLYHLQVDNLGEFTFDETGKSLLYSSIEYDPKLIKKLANVVEVWQRKFSNF